MNRFLMLAALILVLAVSAMATDTRVMTMGNNNNVLLDEANIWLYPGRVIEYPNLAVGEFDSDGFYNFGINWKFNNDNPWVLGTYFSTMPAYVPTDNYGDAVIPFAGLDTLDNRRLDLFYGRSLGGNNFGMHFGYIQSSADYEETTPVNQTNESMSYYNFDFGMTEAAGLWDVALSVGFGTWANDAADGSVSSEPDGFYNFGAIGRYFMQRGPNYTFIPHVGFMYDKIGVKDDAGSMFYKNTMMDAGFGMNYTPSNNVLAVCDFGFMYGKYKEEFDPADGSTGAEYTESYTVLPYFKIGLDADVFKWMDIRLGATSYWNKDNYETETINNTFKYASNETYLGFGFHWNNLHVDTYANPSLFLDGFNFLSGETNSMNYKFSVVYEMM